MAKLLILLPWPYISGGEADPRRRRAAYQEQLRCSGRWRSWSGSGEAQDGVVELARVRKARPRLQLLAVEGVVVVVAEESPTSAVPDVGRRQVGCVADGAPIIGRQRGHCLCSRVLVRLRRYCVARGDLSEGGDLELHPRRQALRRAFALAVMEDVVPSRRTMYYRVEASWALPL